MTISKDLFLAILSMDAYNRGYAPGTNLSSNDTFGMAIGNATVFKNKGDSEAISSGFYAIAYDTSGVAGFAPAGNDTFVFRASLGQDTVTDFTAGQDVLEFGDGIFADAAAALAAATASGNNTLITIDANNSVLLQNVTLANLHVGDFHIVCEWFRGKEGADDGAAPSEWCNPTQMFHNASRANHCSPADRSRRRTYGFLRNKIAAHTGRPSVQARLLPEVGDTARVGPRRYGPCGRHFVVLAQHSDQVLNAVLTSGMARPAFGRKS